MGLGQNGAGVAFTQGRAAETLFAAITWIEAIDRRAATTPAHSAPMATRLSQALPEDLPPV